LKAKLNFTWIAVVFGADGLEDAVVELFELISRYRDRSLAEKLSGYINELCDDDRYLIMHVCGTHEWTITHFGIRSLIPKVDLRAGPGCPVCVASPVKIQVAVELSMKDNVVVTTFGDMFKVRGLGMSLMEAKSRGGKVKVVYSIWDAVNLARKYSDKEIVHFAIGFETTAPSSAAVLLKNPPKNFSIICTHLLIPPVMEYLLRLGEIKIDGFICPGHVSTIIGVKPYRPIARKYCAPMVVAGFEPIDVLIGVAMLIQMIKERRFDVVNEYVRVVKYEGNVRAQRMMYEVFDICDADWRGIGRVPNSGLKLKSEFERFDAELKFGIEVDESYEMPPGCRCGEVLRGLIMPWECPLFARACNPLNPVGPCMVSSEGACSIAYKHSRRRIAVK